MKLGNRSKHFWFLFLFGSLGLLLAGQVSAQSILHRFSALSGVLATNSDGANPYGGLVLSGTTLFGNASYGGSSSNGTVFALDTDGTHFRILHTFTTTLGAQSTNSDGANPFGGLLLSANRLYGTSSSGGSWGNGTVFAINTDGTGFTNLHNFTATPNSYPFTNSDGARPRARLVLSGNALYGTTTIGGLSGNGTVFALNTDGTGLTNLHSFTAIINGINGPVNTDGAGPMAGLVLVNNTLYGTAPSGGSVGRGVVFAINTDGTGFTNLHSFSKRFNGVPDGAYPSSALVISGNTLYGTARGGGAADEGTVFKISTDGTGLTNLHSFAGLPNGVSGFPDADGGAPVGGVVLSDSTLFGTTQYGGTTRYPVFVGSGTVFAINTDGSGFTNLYRFQAISTNAPYGNNDGAFPSSGLILSTNALYGSASGGGVSGSGTILSLPLTPSPPPPQFLNIYADFSTANIQTTNMTVTPSPYFSYNSASGGSWGISAPFYGFIGTFAVPADGNYWLTVDHQTSSAASCPGGGYSPINIYVNGTLIASGFDPAQQNGGSLGEVTNSWRINALAGSSNTIEWSAGALCTRYWIQGIQIAPANSPVLKWSAGSNSVTLFWETNWSGFVLESCTNLGGVWSQVSPGPVLIGDLNFATNTSTAPLRLFRLRYTTGP